MNKYKRLALCIIFVLSICACGCVSRKIGENEKSLLLSINDIKANNTLPAFQTASCENYAGKKIAFGDDFLSPVLGDFRSPSRFALRNKAGGDRKVLYLCP